MSSHYTHGQKASRLLAVILKKVHTTVSDHVEISIEKRYRERTAAADDFTRPMRPVASTTAPSVLASGKSVIIEFSVDPSPPNRGIVVIQPLGWPAQYDPNIVNVLGTPDAFGPPGDEFPIKPAPAVTVPRHMTLVLHGSGFASVSGPGGIVSTTFSLPESGTNTPRELMVVLRVPNGAAGKVEFTGIGFTGTDNDPDLDQGGQPEPPNFTNRTVFKLRP